MGYLLKIEIALDTFEDVQRALSQLGNGARTQLENAEEIDKPYAFMNMRKAMEKYLEIHPEPQTANQIAQQLLEGGYSSINGIRGVSSYVGKWMRENGPFIGYSKIGKLWTKEATQ